MKDVLEDYMNKRNTQTIKKKSGSTTYQTSEAIGKIIIELGFNKVSFINE